MAKTFTPSPMDLEVSTALGYKFARSYKVIRGEMGDISGKGCDPAVAQAYTEDGKDWYPIWCLPKWSTDEEYIGTALRLCQNKDWGPKAEQVRQPYSTWRVVVKDHVEFDPVLSLALCRAIICAYKEGE